MNNDKTALVVILNGKMACENCKTVLNEHVPDQCPECGREFK